MQLCLQEGKNGKLCAEALALYRALGALLE